MNKNGMNQKDPSRGGRKQVRHCFLAMIFCLMMIFFTSAVSLADVTSIASPTNVKITYQAGTITVSWDPVSGAEGYVISLYKFDSDDDEYYECNYTTVEGSAYSTKFQYTAKGRYYAEVCASRVVYDEFWEEYTTSFSEFTQSEAADVILLPKPAGLTFSAGLHSFKVSWNKIEDARGYRVQLYNSENELVDEKECGSTNTTFTGIAKGKYYVKVCGYIYNEDWGEDLYGDEAVSSTVTAKVLSAPKNLKVTPYYNSHSDYGLKVSWDKVSGAEEYCVKVFDANSSYALEYNEYDACAYTDKTSYTLKHGYYCDDISISDGKWNIVVEACLYESDGSYSHGSRTIKKNISLQDHDVLLTSAKQSSLQNVKLKWTQEYSANIYYIYRKVSGGSYKLVKTVKDYTITSWTDTNISIGKTYYYKVRYEGYYGKSGYSNVVRVDTKLKAPTVTVASASITSIRISFGAMPKGVDGYEIYRASSSGGSYTKVKTITDSSKTSWTDTKKKIGVKWYYKVRAYKKDSSGNKTYGSYSSAKVGKANLAAVTIKSVKAKNGNSAVLTWGKVADATGYEIYYCTTKNGTYKKGATIAGGSRLTGTVKKLVNGKNYYFKVRAKRSTGKTIYKGDFSALTTKTINTFSYASESYSARCKRVFGKSSYVYYSTASEAQKHMTTITVKCWDINGQGHKYTRYMSFEIHKNMAGTAKQIFKEIYEGKEKFPIHSIIGYGWRGNGSSSEHNQGLAIDVNPDENYFYDFYNKTILAGTCFKPGKNPYSIPEYGEVEKIFEKYGFTRGRWSTRTDYMHFSYFGV